MQAALLERLFYCPPFERAFLLGGPIRLQPPSRSLSTGVHMDEFLSYLDLLITMAKLAYVVLKIDELLKKLRKRK
jgi:hypothetical protein